MVSQTQKLSVSLLLVVFVGVTSCIANEFDLMAIERIAPKGRVQDSPVDPEIAKIIAIGQDTIPELIELVSSSKNYEHRPVNFWPEYSEGDMAFAEL